MASCLVHHYRPRVVQLCVKDPEIAVAAVQRLTWKGIGLVVEHEELREKIRQSLGLNLGWVDTKTEPDVTLMLFSRKKYATPPIAGHIVLLDKNALSYKGILYPGQIEDNVVSQVRWLQQKYKLDRRIGLFGPSFLFYWSFSLMAGSQLAPIHFRLGQQALDRVYMSTGVWWTGYIVVLSGARCR